MINICGNTSEKEVRIEYDYYVPVSIEFLGKSQNAIYLRYGNNSKNLLEIGIGELEQSIKTITWIIGGEIYLEEKLLDHRVKRDGCPILDLKREDGQTYYDIIKTFRVFIGKDTIYFELENGSTYYCISNKNVDFYSNENEVLTGICIRNINHKDIEIIKEAVESRPYYE